MSSVLNVVSDESYGGLSVDGSSAFSTTIDLTRGVSSPEHYQQLAQEMRDVVRQ